MILSTNMFFSFCEMNRVKVRGVAFNCQILRGFTTYRLAFPRDVPRLVLSQPWKQ